jgi:hypothetical protein
MKKLLLSLLSLSFILSASAQEKYSYVQIPIATKTEFQQLMQLGFALDEIGGRTDESIELYLGTRELKRLEQNGIPYRVLIDDWYQHYDEQQRAVIAVPQLIVAQQVKNFHLGTMGGYLTLAETMAELDSMQQKFPNLISKKDTIGFSLEGRPIIAVKISKNSTINENEPRAFYNALHHAREPITIMQMMYFMWYLLENYGTDYEVTSLLNTRELYFVPIVNPDGYAYNQQIRPSGGGMWRKNRRLNADSSYGTDLNRNYGFKWGYDDIGSSPIPEYETYRGTAGFSEPETRAIRDFCVAKKFNVAFNYHSYSNLMIYPWGYEDRETSDSLFYRRMADGLTSVTRYTFGTDMQTVAYMTNGNSDDWMYGDTLSKAKIFSITPEVGYATDGFWPQQNRILPLCQDNLSANLYLAHCAGEYLTLKSVSVVDSTRESKINITAKYENIGILKSSSSMQLQVSTPLALLQILNPNPTYTRSDTSVLISLDYSGIAPGTNLKLFGTSTYGGGMSIDSMTVRPGPVFTLFSDSAESNIDKWISTGGWGRTSEASHSGIWSFTESPTGNYSNNVTSTLTLKNPLTPSLLGAAELRYWTKWYIETNYDFGRVQISTNNGVTWKSLNGRYTGYAFGSAKQKPTFDPGYDGVRHEWVEENIDLGPFLGYPLLVRFLFESDGFENYSGWLIDDIRIIGYPIAPDYAERGFTPESFKLEQNYPNPFNPTTAIGYKIPAISGQRSAISFVRLKIFDMLGKEVATLVNAEQQPGRYTVHWNASGVPSGVYFYQLRAGEFVQTKKMMVVR